MIANILKTGLFIILVATATNADGQICHNLYPYADGAVYDNNGYDLRGFVRYKKKDVIFKAEKINQYSGGDWGYLAVNTVRVPSVSTPHGKWKDVNLSHTEYIDATLALAVTKEGLKGTWWARQCNSPQGPLVYTKVEDGARLDIDNVLYTDITKEMELKKFTIVEYTNESYNQRDYDQLIGNYLLMENGMIKSPEEYKAIISFYSGFLSKFTYTEDPLLETKSFVTFLSCGNTKYVGYFNIVNSKLAGHLEVLDLQFEKDKNTIVDHVFKQLNTKVVYVYGDDLFGMEKVILKYRSDHDLKLIRRPTNTTLVFNEK